MKLMKVLMYKINESMKVLMYEINESMYLLMKLCIY